jgi:hypothetical protein
MVANVEMRKFSGSRRESMTSKVHGEESWGISWSNKCPAIPSPITIFYTVSTRDLDRTTPAKLFTLLKHLIHKHLYSKPSSVRPDHYSQHVFRLGCHGVYSKRPWYVS